MIYEHKENFSEDETWRSNRKASVHKQERMLRSMALKLMIFLDAEIIELS